MEDEDDDLQLPVVRPPRDPARIGLYPPTFPLEVALRQMPVADVCAAYGLTKDDWNVIRKDPVFIKELEAAAAELRKDGMSFKVKARLQSEMLLEKSWHMIHDAKTPPAIQADLLKHTIRVAGLDASKDQAGGVGNIGTALQININLG